MRGEAPELELRGPEFGLRFAVPADAPALMELGRDPEVVRFFSWGPYEREDEPRAYVERLAADRAAGRQMDFLVVRLGDGAVLGVTGISELSRRDRRAVVGTWLGRAHWGSGANAESKALVAALAFRTLGLERLGAYAAVENERSRRALERLGFRPEGTLRRWHRHGERVYDVVTHSLLRDEWERSPLAAVPVEISGSPPAAWVP